MIGSVVIYDWFEKWNINTGEERKRERERKEESERKKKQFSDPLFTSKLTLVLLN